MASRRPTKRPTKQVEEKFAPYQRLWSFANAEEMERFDAALAGVQARHEADRYQSEVRHVLNLRVAQGALAPRNYLAGVERKRGKEAADQLLVDATAQWKLGSRGERGRWESA